MATGREIYGKQDMKQAVEGSQPAWPSGEVEPNCREWVQLVKDIAVELEKACDDYLSPSGAPGHTDKYGAMQRISMCKTQLIRCLQGVRG